MDSLIISVDPLAVWGSAKDTLFLNVMESL